MTVTPSAFFAALISASGTDSNATLRCGVIDRFIDSFGAVSGNGTSSSRSRRTLNAADDATPEVVGGLHELHRPRCERQRRIAEQLDVGRNVLRLPLRRDVGDLRLRIGLEVEERREDLDTRRAVDQRVVDLGDERVVAVVEAFDDPRLPERAACGRAAGPRRRRRTRPARARRRARAARHGASGSRDRRRDPRSRSARAGRAAPRRSGAGTAGSGAGATSSSSRTCSYENPCIDVVGSTTATPMTCMWAVGVSSDKKAASSPVSRCMNVLRVAGRGGGIRGIRARTETPMLGRVRRHS